MSKSEYLFLFTVGPVQSFIAQARKTRDLYAGSAILGEIVDAAIGCAGSDNVIVPDAKLGAKPNRFLAKIYAANALEARKIGAAVEKTAQAKWMEIANEAFKNAQVKSQKQSGSSPAFKGTVDILTDSFVKETSALRMLNTVRPCEAASQIQNHLEIYWVAVELNGDYKEKHDELQKLLGAIKNTRRFTQIDEPAGRKCSLDGERNALFYRPDEKHKRPHFIQNGAQQVDEWLTPGEALSAVSLVKRFYAKQEKFPSTAEIALMKVIDDHLLEKKKYKMLFQDFDYQCCYEENLTDIALKKSGVVLSNGATLAQVQKACKELTEEKRTKYYAILVFDGDNMGKIWSGEGLKNYKDLLNFQKKLAELLGKFAEEAQKCLTPPRGKTVYAGGDDFLGFVNLNDLFEVMKVLRQAYTALVEKPIKNEFKESFTGSLTFTAGVAIAHYKEPLGEALKKARAVEKKAKDLPNKDAFGISVMKSSGEINEAYLNFYLQDSTKKKTIQIPLIEKVVEALQKEDGFSNTFIKSFEREMRKVMDKEGNARIYSSAIQAELERLLNRSSKQSGEKKENAVKEFLPVVSSLKNVARKTENYFSIMNICDFIKRETTNES